jgi:nucleoside-diphosphate-sugar epimerase
MGERADPGQTLTLVTGGAGYLGSILVEQLLARGRRVRVLDNLVHGGVRSLLSVWSNPHLEFVAGDVRDGAVRATAVSGVTDVVHLAALVGDPACAREPDLAWDLNVEATRGLVQDAGNAGVERFVFASTCSNYGRLETDEPATEEWELRPVSLYAETKVTAEREILAQSNGMAATCLRLATVYGVSPRMRFDLTVNEFTRDAFVTNELVVYGEQFWRPYLHVHDAARAIVLALEAPRPVVDHQVFNVGDSDENYRKEQIVELVRAEIPNVRVTHVEQVDDPRDYRVSFERIRSALGYEGTRTVADGVREVARMLAAGMIADPFAELYRN